MSSNQTIQTIKQSNNSLGREEHADHVDALELARSASALESMKPIVQ